MKLMHNINTVRSEVKRSDVHNNNNDCSYKTDAKHEYCASGVKRSEALYINSDCSYESDA